MISKGNHVKFARFALLAVSEDWSKTMTVFVISIIIEVSVRVISLCPSASADNPYLDLDYSRYHKNLIQ